MLDLVALVGRPLVELSVHGPRDALAPVLEVHFDPVYMGNVLEDGHIQASVDLVGIQIAPQEHELVLELPGWSKGVEMAHHDIDIGEVAGHRPPYQVGAKPWYPGGMWKSQDEAYAYHRWVVSQLSDTQREAYEYIEGCRTGRMANDLASDLGINPLTAGNVMHELARRGLVRRDGDEEGTTSHGHTAKRYIPVHPTRMLPPIPNPTPQNLDEKWNAIKQFSHLLQFFNQKHRDAKRLTILGQGRIPEYEDLLRMFQNILLSAMSASRQAGDDRG